LILLLAGSPAVAAPAIAGSSPQSCAVRLLEQAGGETAQATYTVACPGTAPTLLSVTYNSPSPSGAAATTPEPRLQSARAPGR
jgi:hypothetical protein